MEKTTISNYFNSQDFLKVLAMVTTQESPNSLNITTNVGALMEKAFNFMKLTNFTAKPEQITDFLTEVAKIHNQTSQLETEAQQNNEQQVEDIKQQYQEPIQQGQDIAREQDIETGILM